MSHLFFTSPILNSPYEYSRLHWELDESGQPAPQVIRERRKAKFVTPIPKPKKQKHAPDASPSTAEVSGTHQQRRSAKLRGQVIVWFHFLSLN
jgi:hypothetical protein